MQRRTQTDSGQVRDRILDSAIVLLRQSGLAGAGINQILLHSQAPKGSMYYYFPKGKLQITEVALAQYGKDIAQMMDSLLASETDPQRRVKVFFDAVADRLRHCDFNESCPAGAVALDLTDDVSRLRPVLARILRSWQEAIAAHFPELEAQERASFASLLLTTMEGGLIRGRVDRSVEALNQAGQWLGKLVSRIRTGT